MSVYKIKSSLLLVSTCLLAACGGGGSDDAPLSPPYTPSVRVAGLDTGAGETVVFNVNGATITADSNTTFRVSSQVVGNYSASVVTAPTGKFCGFNGGASIYTGSAKLITLTCAVGLPGGGGGTLPPPGGAGDVGNNPFQVFGWGSDINPNLALITRLTSITNFSNAGLTNATTDNFSFSIDEEEVIPGGEHRFHVEPLNNGLSILAGALAVDIGTSLTDAQIVTMKQQLTAFLAGVEDNRFYRISWFDNRIVEEAVPLHPDYPLPGYTNVTADLQAAVANIPDTISQRGNSTNLYGATRDAAISVGRAGPLLDYVVMISDGDHTTTGDELGDQDAYDDDTEFNLIFAIAIGPNPDLARLERVITVRNEAIPALKRIIRIDDVSQLGAALQTIDAYVGNLQQGLHAIHYVTPRRDDPDIDDEEVLFNYSVKQRSACDAEQVLLGCGWDMEFDPLLFTSPMDKIWVFANSQMPLVGDTVRLRIPEWPSDHCSSSIDYNWNLTVNSGAATLSAPRNNAREIDVIFGVGAPSNVTVDIDNVSLPGCSGSIDLLSWPAP